MIKLKAPHDKSKIMKASLILILLIIASLVSNGQEPIFTITGTANSRLTTQTGKYIDKGAAVQLISFSNQEPYPKGSYLIQSGDTKIKIPVNDGRKITWDVPKSHDEVWQTLRVISDFDNNYASRGLQYGLRQELEDETVSLMSYLDEYYGFFNDAYLEDYIQGILYSIHSPTLNDDRPGNLTVKIIQLAEPNAFCTPTGTIIITTGLLSTIKSEDELVGVLSHEVAHFVLDHQVININKAQQRQKRAEFWAGLATVIAATSEVYLAAKHEVYLEGNLTMATATFSSAVAAVINERIGTNYNHQQELEADTASVFILKYMKKDHRALSAALSRIRNYSIVTGNYSALRGNETHPALNERIARIGICDPESFNNTNYDKIISLVNTQNAIYEFNLSHLEAASDLADRNITSGAATEDDYLVKAMSIRILHNTTEKSQEALDLILKAKSLNVTPRNYLNKQEAITLIRLGKKGEAKSALQTYLKNLESILVKDTFTFNEMEWTKKMISKLAIL